MCKTRRLLLRHEARNGISARNSVSCQSQCYGVTERGNVTSVYPPYDEVADDEHDLQTLSTYMWYTRSFDRQNVIQLQDASQAANHLKDTEKF